MTFTEQLEALLAKATPGPWQTADLDQGMQIWSGAHQYIGATRDYTGDDAALIVLLRNNAPAILIQAREIERLKAANDILEDALQEVGDDYPWIECAGVVPAAGESRPPSPGRTAMTEAMQAPAREVSPSVGDELYVRVKVSHSSKYENGEPQWMVYTRRPGRPEHPGQAFWMGLDADYFTVARAGGQSVADEDASKWAVLFHELYERLAPSFGYETRADTKQFDPESQNGKLMLAVCGQIVAKARLEGRREGIEAAAEACVTVREGFLSPEYATHQPLSSFNERFACDRCGEAILAIDPASIGEAPTVRTQGQAQPA